MGGFDPDAISQDQDIDESIPHPSPDEIGIMSIYDPNFLEELDRRAADGSPTIPWSELEDEPPRLKK
jgi:hypothetical protein